MKLTMFLLATLSLLNFSFVSAPHHTVEVGIGSSQTAIATEINREKLDCKGSSVTKSQAAGLIRSVGSRCYRQAGDARPALLDPKRDRGVRVFAGERFQCFEGSMMFELKGSTVKTGTIYTIRPVDGCHTLKAPAVSRRGSGSVKKSRGTSPAGLPSSPPRRGSRP